MAQNLNAARILITGLVLASAFGLISQPACAQNFTTTGSMTTTRYGDTATLLNDEFTRIITVPFKLLGDI
jgi:hypothetical protein